MALLHPNYSAFRSDASLHLPADFMLLHFLSWFCRALCLICCCENFHTVPVPFPHSSGCDIAMVSKNLFDYLTVIMVSLTSFNCCAKLKDIHLHKATKDGKMPKTLSNPRFITVHCLDSMFIVLIGQLE